MTANMIRIPTPAKATFFDMNALGTFTFSNNIHIRLFWWNRCVIITDGADWYLQKDGGVAETLKHFHGNMNYAVKNLFLFEDGSYRHGRSAPHEIAQHFLDCDWSDFACDRLVVSGNICAVQRPYGGE
jgi:hypothetical protein